MTEGISLLRGGLAAYRATGPEMWMAHYLDLLAVALWELRAAVSLARLRRDPRGHAEARDLLAPIYDWFTEGFATPDLKEAKALLDELT